MTKILDTTFHRKIILLTGLCIAAALAWPVAGAEDEVAERIQKVGTVCVEGEACAQVAAASPAASDTSSDVEGNYNKSCAVCHNAGVAGAPKLADVAVWAPRIAKGMEPLYASAINGMPPAMPAKGMCFACSDDDLKALVDYMVDAAQ